MNHKYKINKQLCLKVLLNIVISLLLSVLYLKYVQKSIVMQSVIDSLLHFKRSIYIDRILIYSIMLMYIGCHFIFNVKDMYKFIFNKRWWFALGLLFILVVCKYNGDSISIYSNVVQPGQGSQYVNPVIGQVRPIRSDEWIVDTPSKLASRYGENPYSKYNEVLRGTSTLNSITGVYFDYSTIGKSLFNFAIPILGVEYGMSFAWFAPIILLFMVTIEMFLIITKRNKILSVTGACLITFSSFYLWWNFPSQLLSLQAAIVCIYYYLNSNNKYYKTLLLGGLVLAAANFITVLYPAWQVPMGFVGLVLLIWVLHENFNKVKEFKKFDYISISVAFCLLIFIVASYFYKNMEYVQAISNTVYPGSRKDYGGYGINKIFYYLQAMFYGYADVGNPSEESVFFSLFPIPLIYSTYLWIKSKKKDILTGGLLLISYVFLIYVIVGMVPIIAKVTLMTFTMPYRIIDVIGFIQVFLIIIILSKYQDIKKPKIWISILSGVITVSMCIFVSHKYYPNYISKFNLVIASMIILFLCILLISAKDKKSVSVFCIIAIFISVYTAYSIRPLTKGLDAIYSKPVAKVIQDISSEDLDAKWIAYGGGNVLPSYTVACGAPTINSVNIYPNMDTWKELDQDDKYEDIYNRYAHINLSFTDEETSFSLIQSDYINVKLSYKDIKKIGVKYIFSLMPLESNSSVNFDCIYNEYGSYIYSVN